MDQNGFRVRDWLSGVDNLTALQRKGASAALSAPPEGKASLAAIELGGTRCGVVPLLLQGALSRSKARALRRFRCKGCGKTNLQRSDAHQVVRSAPQGALACLWRFPCRRGDHQGVG